MSWSARATPCGILFRISNNKTTSSQVAAGLNTVEKAYVLGSTVHAPTPDGGQVDRSLTAECEPAVLIGAHQGGDGSGKTEAVVVVEFGAGGANMLFLRPGTAVVILCPPNHHEQCLWYRDHFAAKYLVSTSSAAALFPTCCFSRRIACPRRGPSFMRKVCA